MNDNITEFCDRYFYVFHASSNNLSKKAKIYLRPYDAVTVGTCAGHDYEKHSVGTEQNVEWTCDIYRSLESVMAHIHDFDLSTVTFLSGERGLDESELKYVSDYINAHPEMLSSSGSVAARRRNYPKSTLRHIAHDRLGEKLAKCRQNGLDVDATLSEDYVLSEEYKQDLVSVSGQEDRSCETVFESQANNTYRFSATAMSRMTQAVITNDEMNLRLAECLEEIRSLEDVPAGFLPELDAPVYDDIQSTEEFYRAKDETEKGEALERACMIDSLVDDIPEPNFELQL